MDELQLSLAIREAISSGDQSELRRLHLLKDELISRLERDERNAELPILVDLASVGEPVESVWDFVNTARPYPKAHAVLVEHLRRGGYPSRVMESLGRALAVKPAVAWWPDLVNSYVNARCDGERLGAGIAIAACATKEHFGELCDLLLLEIDDPTQARIGFLSALIRVDRARAWPVVERLREHPLLGKRATALLKRRDKA